MQMFVAIPIDILGKICIILLPRAFFNIVTGRPNGLPVARFGLPVNAKPASLGDQDFNQVVVQLHYSIISCGNFSHH